VELPCNELNKQRSSWKGSRVDSKAPSDARALHEETRRLWEQKATFWDEQMSEGNAFHRHLVAPATERLIAVQPAEMVLDVACGNGQMARRLAQFGAQVVACDFSETFIELARARTTEHAERIDYQVLDATDRDQLLALGRHRFDAAVCSMALMDMATIDPLMQALPHLLKSHGRFIFSVQHPCFNSNAVDMVAELRGNDTVLRTVYSLKLSQYLNVPPGKGAGMPGEPTGHYYFHRPLSQLLGSCFRAGFVLDGLEEPAFEEGIPSTAPISWAKYTDIPPVLVARLRLP
jgi:2-polyprenyl-3-methyl-5-hydroxy-6-metoxy-1,4-benzoquinol methylase